MDDEPVGQASRLSEVEQASRPSPVPDDTSILAKDFPWRETGGLLLAMVLLWLVFYHGDLRTWPVSWLRPLGPGLPRWLSHWDRFFWFGLNFVVLFLLPVGLLKFVWHERVSDYGLSWGQPRVWGKYLLVFTLVMAPALVIASRLPELHHYYPIIRWAADGPGPFLLAALGWLVYFFAWEFFFRGFLLNLVARRYGAFAIVVQTIPFVMMHYRKPELEALASVVAGMALGWMAYRGKSFLGTWLLHWAVAIGLDLLVVVWR